MKKVLSIMLIVALAVSAVFAQGGKETTSETKVHEWKWSMAEPESHAWCQFAYKIAEEIEARTNGSVKITVFTGNALGTQAEVFDMLRTGSVAMEESGPSIMGTFYDPIQVWSLPYAFDNAEQGYAFFDSEVGQEMFNDIILKKTGVRTLAVWYFGDRNLTTKGIPVQTPADLKGEAVRCMDTPIAKVVVSSLGGNPVPINSSELYLALQTGTVVGQENPVPSIISNKYYEVQDNVILTKHSVHMGTIHVSEKLWQELSVEEQNIIMEVLNDFRDDITNTIRQQTEEGYDFLKAQGINIIEPDLTPFKELAAKTIEQNFANDAEWMKRINQLNEFKKEYDAKNN